MNPLPNVSQKALADFCRHWEIAELSLFGSALRGEEFGPESDLDFLVQFAQSARPSLFDLVRMKDELEGLVGREVDLVTKAAIEASRNPVRRRSILQSTYTIHVTKAARPRCH